MLVLPRWLEMKTVHYALLFLSTVLSVAMLSANAGAAKIYKYQSENGTLSFTDKYDDSKKLVNVEQVEPYEPKYRVSIDKVGGDADFKLVAHNEYYGPVEIRFDLKHSENMTSNYRFPCSFVVKAREKRDLFSMRIADKNRGAAYSYTTGIVIGDPAADHDDSILYDLPIAVKDVGRVYVSQGFNGSSTHDDVQNRYAIDIPAPEGTSVRAARAGMVMDVANDYFRTGQDSKLLSRANYVRILHDDGTMALYAHLQLESIQVQMGGRVEAGQILARVGSTGYSSGPHLHFVVQKNFGDELRAVPFRLPGPDGTGVAPVTGMTFQ
jgi:murein DD-endopeptidase MepM/ murein hydrolase activator NlpD